MKTSSFEFKGRWVEIPIFLEAFAFLDHPELSYGKGGHGTVTIYDPDTLNVDPAPEQLRAIKWLLEAANQTALLENVLNYIKGTIYPEWREHTWQEEYPEAYPELNELKDLRNNIAVSEILVDTLALDGQALFAIHWNTFLDYEHGISTVHKGAEVIAYGEGFDYEIPAGIAALARPIYPPGEEPTVHHSRNEDYTFYEPHPKYNVLRQWQRYHNDHLPVKMIRQGMFKELYELYEAHPEILSVGSNMIISAITRNEEQGEELVRFLLPRMESFHISVVRYALEKERYDLLDQILASGYDINGPLGQDALISPPLVAYYKAYEDAQERLSPLRQIKWLIDNGLNPYLEERFGRNAFFTLNRYDDKRRIQAIEREVDDLIAGSKPGPEPGSEPKPWWKRLF